MKAYSVILFLTMTFNLYAQADLKVHFLMYDNAPPPYTGSSELIFGLDSTATDGIDVHLGEQPIPPDVCCGWGGPILCAGFQLPIDPNPVQIDYRFGELPYSGVKVHRISYCSWPTSTLVTIRCKLPPGASALLQDDYGGLIFNITMIDSNEYYIADGWIGVPLRFTVTYNNVTPVELESFNASILNSSVVLSWSTAGELNNAGFEIQRKNYSGWHTVAFVTGQGTTTEISNYTYTDNLEDLENVSKLYYRLKQLDYDGSYEYSKEIDVTIAVDYRLEQNYPNPFNPATTITYSIPVQGKVRLIVYDALGKEVSKLVDEQKTAGRYEIEFNADALASGIYFYRLSTGEMVISKKMLLMR